MRHFRLVLAIVLVAVIELAFPRRQDLDRQTMVYEPEIREGKIVAWHCHVDPPA